MGDGQYDADEPDGRRPLPPEDRVWRHPAEVALEARRSLARRRTGRIKTGATLVGGLVAVSALAWVSGAGRTQVAVTNEAVRPASANGADTRPGPETLFTFRDPADETAVVDAITVRSAVTGEALAGALMVREGYVVTSGDALEGAEDVVIAWGTSSELGQVIGHDEVTDVTVIRVDGPTTGAGTDAARIREGDEVKMSTDDGRTSSLRVVQPESTSAMANGDPVVGIVELDGRIGDVRPGSPAYNANGDLIGIATATADSAPAALVPIRLAREVADEIIATGEAIHPWLGVTARSPTEADSLDLAGSLITAVTSDGPAEGGGVLTGDLITLIDDRAVDSMASMVATLRFYEPGDVVEIVVWRDDSEVTCTVELASHHDVDA